MLEEQIAADMASMIVSSAKHVGALRVVQAQVIIGELRQVDETVLRSHLSAALKGTVAQGAAIVMERPALTLRCLDCGTVHQATAEDPASYICPQCGSDRREVATGMELDLGEMQAYMPSTGEGSIADKLAKAVEDALGPVESPAER